MQRERDGELSWTVTVRRRRATCAAHALAVLAAAGCHAKTESASVDAVYYGKRASAARCKRANAEFFARTPDYTQSVRDVRIDTTNSSTTRVHFVKAARLRGRTSDFPSYLVLGGDRRITEEGDEVTDANLKKKTDAAPTCHAALFGVSQYVLEHACVDADGNHLSSRAYILPGVEGGKYCAEVWEAYIDDPDSGAGHAAPICDYCVDLGTGATTMNGPRVPPSSPVSLPRDTARDVARLCAGDAAAAEP